MEKLPEKVIAGLLSQIYEVFSKLYSGQIGARKQRYAIDVVVFLVHKFQKCWTEKKLATALFMDVKGACDYVSTIKLVERMTNLGIDRDIVRWTQFFLTGWTSQLIIDRHNNIKCDIEIKIPQGSLVLPILFLIYISGVFDKIAESNPESLFFVDDLGFIAFGYLVKGLAKTLERVAKLVLEWRKYNVSTYNIAKTEALLSS